MTADMVTSRELAAMEQRALAAEAEAKRLRAALGWCIEAHEVVIGPEFWSSPLGHRLVGAGLVLAPETDHE